MAAPSPMLNFCVTPTLPSSFNYVAFPTARLTPRRPRLKSATVGHQRICVPSMSLTNDLLVKALEVGVATFVGNSFAEQQAQKEEKGGFFGIGKNSRKSKRKQTPAKTIDADQVQNIVGQVLRFAEDLPGIVEKGGPDGKKWVKLAICICIDLVGSGSLAVPFLGDALDLVTAPLSAVMLQALFDSTLVTMGGFAEEILPGTDGIPTATLAWLAENYGYLKSDEGMKNEKRG